MWSNLLLLPIMIVFSIEDIRNMSIPSFWFWVLLVIVLALQTVDAFFFPTLHSLLSLNIPLCIELKPVVFGILERCLLMGFTNMATSVSLDFSCFISVASFVFSIAIRSLFGFILMGTPMLVTKKKGVGEGDVLFFVILSILFSFEQIWMSYCVAFVSGSLWCAAWYVCKNKKLPKRCPFIPFISFGFLFSMIIK